MATVRVRLTKTTRLEGEHVEAGSIVELEGRDAKTGQLSGDARYMVSRGFAEELGEDDAPKGEAAAPRAKR